MGAFTASLFGTLVLVAVPLLLLGTVSPWATRIEARVGRGVRASVAGRLYAISTIGSLIGVFFVSLWAIEAIGTQRTFLVLAALPGARRRRRASARAAARPAGAGRGALRSRPGRPSPPTAARVLYETETPYQYARVVEDGRRHAQARAQRGPGDPLAAGAPGTVLTGGYWDGFLMLPFATGSGAPAGADRRARHRRRDGSARVRAVLPGDARSTPSTSTRSCSRSGAATSGCRRARSCASSPRTRGRSCAARTSATTRSSSTPTASPTSPST